MCRSKIHITQNFMLIPKQKNIFHFNNFNHIFKSNSNGNVNANSIGNSNGNGNGNGCGTGTKELRYISIRKSTRKWAKIVFFTG